MENEIPLPYFLQKHEITKTYKYFSNTKCRRVTSNDYESLPHGWIFHIF